VADEVEHGAHSLLVVRHRGGEGLRNPHAERGQTFRRAHEHAVAPRDVQEQIPIDVVEWIRCRARVQQEAQYPGSVPALGVGAQGAWGAHGTSSLSSVASCPRSSVVRKHAIAVAVLALSNRDKMICILCVFLFPL